MTNINYGYAMVSRVIRVIDGDSFICDLGGNVRNPGTADNYFLRALLSGITIRLSRINAPEINSVNKDEAFKALLAQTELSNLLKAAQTIRLTAIRRDKYFRLNAEVWVNNDINVNDWMVINSTASYLRP